MARIDNLANFLTDIANKIRSKTGSQSNITPANYDTEIEKIAFNPGCNMSFDTIPASQGGGVDNITTHINLKNLDTSSMTWTRNMFRNKKVLESLDLSNFDTSNIVNMQGMFQYCNALTELDLSSFDTSNVTNMGTMFHTCPNLETITFGNNFTFSSITTMGNMFNGCTKLDNNTLNSILYLCTTVTSAYTGTKTLATLGVSSSFVNYDNIPNLSNYQAFLDAGWTIS